MSSTASSIHRGADVLPDPLLGTETAGGSTALVLAGTRNQEHNPFRLPDDNNIFLLRNREKEQRKMELQRQQSLRVHEKVTHAGRMKAKQAALRRSLREGLLEEEQEGPGAGLGEGEGPGAEPSRAAPAWRTAMLKDRNIDKESMREFIAKKREMFLLEYSLSVKRGEIEQMEQAACAQERKLVRAEKFLEEDAKLFDAFLKENDRDSVEAIKTAEQETKTKLEKMAMIKRTTAKMVAIKSDISKFEDTLKEYSLYKDFLFKLSPAEWQERQRAKVKSATKTSDKDRERDRDKEKERDHKTGRNTEKRGSTAGRELPPLRDPRSSSSRQSRKSVNPSDKPESAVPEMDTDPEYEEAPELFFTEPRQLMDLLTELEEQNLSLIQNSRETEEALEEFRKVMDHTHKKMEQETQQLTQQIDIMSHTIQRERDRAAELELRARLFNYGKYKSDDLDGLLDSLSSRVECVYRACVGDSEADLSALQMLTAVEGRLGALLESMEVIPRDRLLLAEKAKEKERRLRLRDEKLRQQKQHQEERLRRALERAQADIKRTTGKKLMTRSQPPARKQKASASHDITDKEKEEQLYFFT